MNKEDRYKLFLERNPNWTSATIRPTVFYKYTYHKYDPKVGSKYILKYYRNPINAKKLAARMKVYKAVKSGKLTRLSCERCGNIPTQAHHDDYSKPLDIRWLCKKCHGVLSRKRPVS